MNLDITTARNLIKFLHLYIDKRILIREKRLEKKWNLLFGHDNKIIGKLNETLIIYHFKDSYLSKLIYRSFEEDEIKFMRRFLKKSDNFIDIGSNIGLFSLHAAQIVGNKGSVHAFEPTPSTFYRLNQNIDLNGFEKIIKSNNVGISSKKEVLKMNVSLNGKDAWNTFAKESDTPFQEQIEIPVDTLDNYLETNGISPESINLIKIDVEGWEVNVIKGATKTLSSPNSPILMVEFTDINSVAAGTCCHILYDIIEAFGYKWYTYDSVNNILIEEAKRISYPFNNLIAIKNLQLVKNRILTIT